MVHKNLSHIVVFFILIASSLKEYNTSIFKVLKMEETCSSETLVCTLKIIQWHNLEDHNMNLYFYGNLKSHISNLLQMLSGVADK
jgi:hypothetical protein